MRHRKKVAKLGRPADQRRALLRQLTTELLKHGKITTTETKAIALRKHVEKMITLGKQNDLKAHRQVSSFLLEKRQGKVHSLPQKEKIDESRFTVLKKKDKKEKDVKTTRIKVREKTVAQQLFQTIAPEYQSRQGGYVRIVKLPPRRGDGVTMAVIELV